MQEMLCSQTCKGSSLQTLWTMYSKNGSSLSLDEELRLNDNISTFSTLFSILQPLAVDAGKPAVAAMLCFMGCAASAGFSWTDLTIVGWLGSIFLHLPVHISSTWDRTHYNDKMLVVQLHHDRGLANRTPRSIG